MCPCGASMASLHLPTKRYRLPFLHVFSGATGFLDPLGEAYGSPDTAWLSDSVPYPLVTAANPLAYALRVFDDNPQFEQQQYRIAKACDFAGLPVPRSGESVVRNGGHALYAAWLAAKRAAEAYNNLTCNGCCFKSSRRTYKKTLK
jgi:hypothetical protein